MKRLFILFFAYISLFTSVCAQSIPGRDSLLADFSYLADLLEKTHPDPYSGFGGRYFFHKEAFLIKNKLQQQDHTREQFVNTITAFLANIRDQHTYIYPPRSETSVNNRILPVDFKIYGDGIFINRAPQNLDILGSRLMAINDVPAGQLINKVARVRASENIYGTYINLINMLKSETSYQMLFPGSSCSVKLTLELPGGKEKQITVDMLTKNALEAQPMNIVPQTPVISQTGNMAYGFADSNRNIMYFRFNSVMARENFRFTIENNFGNAKEDLANYFKYNLKRDMPQDTEEALSILPSLSESFSNMLLTMKKENAEYLIIDLRGNSGGWTPITLPTLYMLFGDEYLQKDIDTEYSRMVSGLLLAKYNTSLDEFSKSAGRELHLGDYTFSQPATALDIETQREGFLASAMSETKPLLCSLQGKPLYTPGKIYVVTDVHTFSAAFHYAFYLWKMGAVIVGVPCRQAPNTFMENTPFQLPNTKIDGSISNAIQIFLPPNDRRAKIFYPDLMLEYVDYKNLEFDRNAEILYIINTLKKNKQSINSNK